MKYDKMAWKILGLVFGNLGTYLYIHHVATMINECWKSDWYKLWLLPCSNILSTNTKCLQKDSLEKLIFMAHLYFSTQHAPAPSKVLPQTASFKNYWYIVLHIEIKLITKYFLLHISLLWYQELMFDNFVRTDHY